MSKALKTLGLSEINKGCSTGNNWLGSTSNLIESYSPVDGKLIGKVAVSTKEDYEAAMQRVKKHTKHGGLCLHHCVVRLSVSLEINYETIKSL